MIVENGKITKATESELFEYYLKQGYDDIMPFTEYIRICEEMGTKIERGEK